MELTNVSTCVQGSPHFGHDSVFFLFGGSFPLPPDDADEPDVGDPLPLPLLFVGGGGVSFVDLSQIVVTCIGRNEIVLLEFVRTHNILVRILGHLG